MRSSQRRAALWFTIHPPAPAWLSFGVRPLMRTALAILGSLCITLPTLFLLYVSHIADLFRDGMKPGFVPSTGPLALSRFWERFEGPFLYCTPIILFGILCLFILWRFMMTTNTKKLLLRLFHAVYLLAWLNLAAYFIIGLYLGGYAPIWGGVQDGKYILKFGGRYTEVSKTVFTYSWIHGECMLVGCLYIFISSWPLMIFRKHLKHNGTAAA